MRNDRAMAMFLGTSSPSSMESRVAITIASTRETDAATAPGSPSSGQRRLEQLRPPTVP